MPRTSSIAAAALAALLLAAPAQAGTQVGIVYDNATGEIMAVTIPDRDEELDDPAYQRKNGTLMRIPLNQFLKHSPETLQSVVPIPLKKPKRVPVLEAIEDVAP